MKTLILLTLIFGLCSSQSFKFGRCLVLNDIFGFTQSQLSDTWYIMRRTKNVPWDKKDCGQVKVSSIQNGRYPVRISQFDILKQQATSTSGFFYFKNPTASSGTIEQSKWIPGTGKVNIFRQYSQGTANMMIVLYSCMTFGPLKKEYMWVLSKSNTQNTDFAVVNSLTEISSLKPTDIEKPLHTTTCQYLP